MFLICCLIHWVCSWHAAIKSTAATHIERTIRKKSCLNTLLYNSWKHFKIHSQILFYVWSFIAASNFPPMKLSKIPLFPFLFKKFQFSPDFVEFKNPVPPPPSQRKRWDGVGWGVTGRYEKLLNLSKSTSRNLRNGLNVKTDWWSMVM